MKKRPDGRYQLSVLIGYKEDGKPKRKIVYGKTQKEANEKANELRMKHNMGVDIDSNISVEKWANMWLTTYKSGVSYNTRKMYEGVINNYIIPNLGTIILQKLKTVQIQNLINNEFKRGVLRTIKIIHLTINQMLEQAVINDLIIKNPALGVSLPQIKKKHSKRALTDEEMEKIKALELDPRAKAYVSILLYTGMRKSEALALTKKDIDLIKKEITVNKTMIFKGNKAEIKLNPKTKAGIRIIPILNPLEIILTDYLKLVNNDYLFTTQSGEMITDTAFRRMWQRFEKAMGSQEITAHTLRHNFATVLYNAGVDSKMAQSILGHSNISVTMDIYTHLGEANQIEAANRLNDFFYRKD